MNSSFHVFILNCIFQIVNYKKCKSKTILAFFYAYGVPIIFCFSCHLFRFVFYMLSPSSFEWCLIRKVKLRFAEPARVALTAYRYACPLNRTCTLLYNSVNKPHTAKDLYGSKFKIKERRNRHEKQDIGIIAPHQLRTYRKQI